MWRRASGMSEWLATMLSAATSAGMFMSFFAAGEYSTG
jgi:hypothetical protein